MADKTLRYIIEVDGKTGVKVFRKIGKEGKESLEQIGKATDRYNKKTSAALGTLMKLGAGVGGLYALKRGYDAVTDAGREFETAAVDMGRVTDREIGKMRQEILGLSPLLGDSTSLMKGYYQTISSGVRDPADALEFLTGASKAAKSAHVEQDLVVKALSKVMAGYAGEIEDVSEASDLLFTIEKMGQTTFAELVPVIGEVSAISKQLGVNSNEMGAALASVTQTAGSTSQAATQYKAILLGLYKPQEKMRKALKEMGFESGQAAVEQLGLAGTLQAVDQHARKSGIGLGRLFESSEALVGIGPLLQTQFKGYNENLAEMEKKTGATDAAFEKWSQTAEATGEKFRNTINKHLIQIGTKILPQVNEGMDDFSDWVTENEEPITNFFTSLATGVEGLSIAAEWLFEKVGWIPTWAGDLGAALGLVSAGVLDLSDVMAAVSPEALAALVDQFDEDPLIAFRAQAQNLREEIERLKKVTEGKAFVFGGDVARLKKAKIELADVNTQIEQMEFKAKVAAGEFDNISDSWMRQALSAKEATKTVTQDTEKGTAERLAAEKKFQEDRAELQMQAAFDEKEVAEESLAAYIEQSNAKIKAEKEALKKAEKEKEALRWKGVKTWEAALKAEVAAGVHATDQQLEEHERSKTGFDRFVDGWKEGHDEMLQWQADWSDAGTEMYRTFGEEASSALSEGLWDVIQGDAEDFGTYWRNFWDGMLKQMINIVSDMAVQWAMAKAFELGATYFHEGSWNVGAAGLQQGEVPAILKVGEIVHDEDTAGKMRDVFGSRGAFEDHIDQLASGGTLNSAEKAGIHGAMENAKGRAALIGAQWLNYGDLSLAPQAMGALMRGGPQMIAAGLISGFEDYMGVESSLASKLMAMAGGFFMGPAGAAIGRLAGTFGYDAWTDMMDTRNEEVLRDALEEQYGYIGGRQHYKALQRYRGARGASTPSKAGRDYYVQGSYDTGAWESGWDVGSHDGTDYGEFGGLFKWGGTSHGPESGYPVELHGTEHIFRDDQMKAIRAVNAGGRGGDVMVHIEIPVKIGEREFGRIVYEGTRDGWIKVSERGVTSN